jgi:pyruvate/2-oxoacid:ferredoxin oxidoreductase alpha subunit
MVAMDGFVTSHTQMAVDLPEQEQVDRFLPHCRIPHRLRPDHPLTFGQLTWPRETEHHRRQLQEAMEQVPAVLEEALEEFDRVFGRRPHGAIQAEHTEDADTILIACNTVARTLWRVIEGERKRDRRVGMIRLKMFRPFPREMLRRAVGRAKRVGVLDRNHSPGSGGVFWQETAAALRGMSQLILQDYLVGPGGGDVTPSVIEEILDDLSVRDREAEPVWKEVAA